MPELNPRVRAVEVPPIIAAQAWAARYDGRAGPMLDLCQAVPGYAPHPDLLEHMAHAAREPAQAKYGLINGDLALREVYAGHVASLYDAPVSADQVAITAGCNQAFFVTLMAVAKAGDSVLLPTPWFWNHQQSCQVLGIEPQALPCFAEQGFIPDPADAEPLITPATRAIVLISPNNPTGALYPPEVIAAFHRLCQRRNLWLILDETYRDFLPEGQVRAHEVLQDPDWPGHVIQLYSFSKAFCVPGHRLGAMVAGAAVLQQVVKVLDNLHICPQRAGQAALCWGIGALEGWRAGNRTLINARADTIRGAFQRLPDWRIQSLGAYFAYVQHPFAQTPSAAVAERMTMELGALSLPGSAFGPGQDRHIRIAFANTDAAGLEQLASRLMSMAA